MSTWVFRGDFKRFAIDDYVQSHDYILWPLEDEQLFNRIASGDNIFLFSADQQYREVGRVWAKTELLTKLKIETNEFDIEHWCTDYWVNSYPALKLNIHSVRFDTGFMSKLLVSESNNFSRRFDLRGGEQTCFVLSTEQEEVLNRMWHIDHAFIPFKSHSWYVQSSNIAIKKLDRSTFIHNMTGIPKEVRGFFSTIEMQRGERREVTLRFKGKNYIAILEMSKQESSRSRLVWTPQFTEVLRRVFPDVYRVFQESIADKVLMGDPQLKFERIDTYLVSPQSNNAYKHKAPLGTINVSI